MALFRSLTQRPNIAVQREHSNEHEGENLFERVRQEVDLRKFFPFPEDAEEFEAGYWLSHCINPDHSDGRKSMLVFADGCRCQACGFRADTTAVYQMYHPELTMGQCARALLDGDYKLEGKAKPAVERRVLDQDLALRYHLELARSPAALEALEKFGFTRQAIQHFRLGYARVLVRLDPAREIIPETLEGLEYRPDKRGNQVPYQWQWRFSVPVFDGGKLRQVIYRKADPNDLGPKTTIEHRAGTEWLFNKDALAGAQFAVYSSGWGDVIVQWQWGITAVCAIAGDGTFRQEWVTDLGRIPRLYSVTDADEAGLKLRKRLDEVLPWIRHITLPYEVGSKKDVRDFHCEGHTREEYLALMRRADLEKTWKVLRKGGDDTI